MATGLNTGLKPTFGIKNAKHGSENLEGFLTVTGKKILEETFKHRRFERPNNKAGEIYEVLQILKYPSMSVFQQIIPIPQE